MVETREEMELSAEFAALDKTIQMSHDYLLSVQYPQGYWWGELESNPTMEAEYILLNHFLGTMDRKKLIKLANHIVKQQREDGTWGQFYGAPGDLSTSAECYFALKMAGFSPEEPFMRKAREFIISKGGLAHVWPSTGVFLTLWSAPCLTQWSRLYPSSSQTLLQKMIDS